jgi:hypothetical protein
MERASRRSSPISGGIAYALSSEWEFMVDGMNMIRVQIPYHLRTLARVDGDVTVGVAAPVTVRSVLDALEARYPMLSGTIREHDTLQRRPFLRFFACEEDWTHQSPDAPLPEAVVSGKEPLLIIGAIAGG